MSANPTCLYCGGTTELGCLIDRGIDDKRRRLEWWEGMPEPSWWLGFKKPERVFQTVAFRCVNCGFLMEFANQ